MKSAVVSQSRYLPPKVRAANHSQKTNDTQQELGTNMEKEGERKRERGERER